LMPSKMPRMPDLAADSAMVDPSGWRMWSV
jgi:hypothetical protein